MVENKEYIAVVWLIWGTEHWMLWNCMGHTEQNNTKLKSITFKEPRTKVTQP